MTYLRRIGNALSQLLNALWGGNEDVTTSARSHRDGVCRPGFQLWDVLAWILNKIDPGHTKRAWKNDRDEWGE